MPIAVKTEDAKAQHYELPTSFFNLVLGKNFKYRQANFIYLTCYIFILNLFYYKHNYREVGFDPTTFARGELGAYKFVIGLLGILDVAVNSLRDKWVDLGQMAKLKTLAKMKTG